MKTRTTITMTLAMSALLLTGCAGESDPQPTNAPPVSDPVATNAPPVSDPAATPGSTQTSAAGTIAEDADLATTAMPVSVEDAIATAQKAAGDTDVTQIELDYSRPYSAWAWDIDLGAGNEQHEVKVNAETGEILENKTDTEDDPDTPINTSPTITPTAVMKAALGVQPGTISGWSLGHDNGVLVYEVDVRVGADEVDVIVDAETGAARLDD